MFRLFEAGLGWFGFFLILLSSRGLHIVLFFDKHYKPDDRLDLPPWYRSNSSRPIRKGQSRIRFLEQTFAECFCKVTND